MASRKRRLSYQLSLEATLARLKRKDTDSLALKELSAQYTSQEAVIKIASGGGSHSGEKMLVGEPENSIPAALVRSDDIGTAFD